MTTKLAAGIVALGLATGAAWAQNPDLIQSTHDTMKALQRTQQINSDAALGNTAKASAQNPSASSSEISVIRHGAPAAGKSAKAAGRTTKAKTRIAVEGKPAANSAPVKRPVTFTGRDPFLSPVVSQTNSGSGCNVGKRCLTIDQIALKGIVRSEGGMIAVVENSMEKAYFLRENDPVFNGYVLKITGDSIVFKENMQDRLGKPFTREVTKKITTPAV